VLENLPVRNWSFYVYRFLWRYATAQVLLLL
jgi:hypothetical protein